MDVSCVEGKCVVSDCERDYELVDGACVEQGSVEGLRAQGLRAADLLRAVSGFA